MKSIISFIISCILAQQLNAQEFTSKWSDRINCGRNCNCWLLGNDSSSYFLLMNKNNKYYVQKFDTMLLQTREELIFKNARKDGEFLHSFYVDGNIILFVKNNSSNEEQITVSLIDGKSLSVVKGDISVFSLAGGRDTSMNYDFLINKNGQICFFFWGTNKGDNKMRFGNYIYDNQLKELSKIDFSVPMTDLNYYPISLFLDDSNNISVLSSSVEPDFGPLGDSLVAYYRLFKSNKADNSVSHCDLDISHRSPQEFYWNISHSGRLVGYSILQSLDAKYQFGFAHYEFDPVTGRKIVDEVKRFTTKTYGDTISNLFLRNFFIKNIEFGKKGTYVFLERSTGWAKIWNKKIYNKNMYYDEGLVIYINEKNRMEWIQWVPKHQHFESEFRFASYFSTIVDDNAILIYNDNPANVKLKEGDEPKAFKSESETMITLISIDDVEMQRHVIVPDKKNPFLYFWPEYTYAIGGNKIFTIVSMGSFTRLGVISYHK